MGLLICLLVIHATAVKASKPGTAATAPAAAAPASFWPSFLSNAAGSQATGSSHPYAASLIPQAGGYAQLLANPQYQYQYQQRYKQQPQETMTQSVLLSPYTGTYVYQNNPGQQQQQGNYISYTQLVPSFQALHSGGVQFADAYQPRYTNTRTNYTQYSNISASATTPVSGTFTALQGSYQPSAVSLPASWSSLLSAFQPSTNNGAGSQSAAFPLYQPATSSGHLNSLAPITFDNKGYLQGYQFPGFTQSAYGQAFTQPVQQQVTPIQYGTVQGNIKTTAHSEERKAAPVKEKYEYSSKYSKPKSEYDEKDNYQQELDEPEEDSDSSKPSDSYKTSESYKSKYEDDEDSDAENYKNSFDYAENIKRPKFTPPTHYDDEYEEESSDFPSKSCEFFKASPSKSVSSHSGSFADDHSDISSSNFEEQFKSFPGSQHFKSPDFNAESTNQKKVVEYRKKPTTVNEKRVKALYGQGSKVVDSYMTQTQQKDTEIPKTLHYYNYKPPKYSYEKPVDYFPGSSLKTSSPRARTHETHRSNSPGYRDAVGHHSITTTVTKMKMYK